MATDQIDIDRNWNMAQHLHLGQGVPASCFQPIRLCEGTWVEKGVAYWLHCGTTSSKEHVYQGSTQTVWLWFFVSLCQADSERKSTCLPLCLLVLQAGLTVLMFITLPPEFWQVIEESSLKKKIKKRNACLLVASGPSFPAGLDVNFISHLPCRASRRKNQLCPEIKCKCLLCVAVNVIQ